MGSRKAWVKGLKAFLATQRVVRWSQVPHVSEIFLDVLILGPKDGGSYTVIKLKLHRVGRHIDFIIIRHHHVNISIDLVI